MFRLTFSRNYSKHYLKDVHRQKGRFKEIFWSILGFNYFTPEDLLPLISQEDILQQHFSISTHQDPKVSIIIPVYNQLSYTYNCLRTLKKNLDEEIPYEILVVDDCSDDLTPEFFKNQVNGIRYLANEQNLGFLLSCNKAVSFAKGAYICLLNNDTQIKPGWLKALWNVLEENPQAGCAGSKLIYPNGLLQEAGGIVFRNGSTLNFGNLDLPEKQIYNQKRKVDYCSGAGILFKKEDFIKRGGFDTRYVPAYYEDTDLCFEIRHTLSKQVWFIPGAELYHYESITTGKEIIEGNIKGYMKLNKQKFFQKWRVQLQEYCLEGEYLQAALRLEPEEVSDVKGDGRPETEDQ